MVSFHYKHELVYVGDEMYIDRWYSTAMCIASHIGSFS